MKNREILIKQLTYQSTHRGCKETDIILGGFAQNMLVQLNDEELLEYQLILAIDDAVFYDYFAGINSTFPLDLKTNIFKKIMKFHTENAQIHS